MVDTVAVGREMLFQREREHLEVSIVLKLVFQRVDVERHKRHHILADADVEQVVAQREVEQFALPNLLASDLAARLTANVELPHVAHGTGGAAVVGTFQLGFLTCHQRQGADSEETAAEYIDCHDEVVGSETDMVFRGFYRCFEGRVFLSEHGGLDDDHLADAVGDGFGDETHIIAQLLGIVFVLQPAPNEHVAFAEE